MDFKLKKSNLNFRVYTATEIPATGNENDIVIISSTPMKNWILSPDDPSGAPRTDGDVWIKYSVKGETRNVLKTDSMMIAMLSASQYVNGVWVDVEVNSYQNGEWVDWWSTTFIIKAGVIGEYGFMTSPDYTYPAKITQNDGYIYAEGGKSGYGGMVISEIPLNLSGGKTVIADINVVQQTNFADDYCPALIVSTVNPASNEDILAIARTKTTGRQTLTLNVSSIDANCYIGIRMGGYGSSPVPKINIYDIYVE